MALGFHICSLEKKYHDLVELRTDRYVMNLLPKMA